jgi:hypothetical protein
VREQQDAHRAATIRSLRGASTGWSRVTLLVEAPPTREPERRYILDVVLADWLGQEWRLETHERPGVRITLDGDADGRGLTLPDVLFATPAWLEPASLPRAPLRWRSVPEIATGALQAGERLPVMYGAGDGLIRAEPSAVELDVDVFGSCFFMLSRYEERVLPTRDPYGRFPASASIAQRDGFLEVPVADAYVELLWAGLRHLWPRLARRPRRFTVALTHDVDDPIASLGREPLKRLRQLGADVLVRREPTLAARRLRSWAGIARGDYRLDPNNTFDFLMEVSERHGLASAFYFIAAAGTASPEDPAYTLAHPWIRALLRRVHRRGHEIGFHAGFGTHRDAERTRQEFERLRDAAAREGVHQETWGGRQHYLLWENPATWSNWDRAGLDYDTTLGHADRIGFRAGTCHAFRTFHLLERRPLRLRERPFQVMDGTLFQYMGLSPEAAREQVLALVEQCRRYGGTFSLLWHNNAVQAARQKRWYEQLMAAITARP